MSATTTTPVLSRTLARTAALLSNQVDWIESPAPDAMPRITSGGFKIYSNPQPHVWPWQLSFVEGSPWVDKRVRDAARISSNWRATGTLDDDEDAVDWRDLV